MLINLYNINLYFSVILVLCLTTFISISDELIVEIDNPKFSEKGLNDRIYEIKAKKGLKSDEYLELFVVEGKFKSNDNGRWIYLEADKGKFSQIKKFIELEENIYFYTDEGEKIKSDHATFDMKNDIIMLSNNVSHESSEGLIHADSSIITDNFNNIKYLGNVLSVIENDK